MGDLGSHGDDGVDMIIEAVGDVGFMITYRVKQVEPSTTSVGTWQEDWGQVSEVDMNDFVA